ncbi:DUF6804 family protein [Flavobacterium sp. RSB2_4_14]
MTYGFYQFLRFAGLVGFAILAYQTFEQGRKKRNGYLRWTCITFSTDF